MAHRLVAEIELSDEQKQWLSELRNKYSELNYQQKPLSLEIGCPLSDRLPADMLIEYFDSKTRHTQAFNYAIHTISLRREGLYPAGNLVLIPDKGFSNFVRIHNSIYTYSVEPFMNRDLPFRPYFPSVVIGLCADVTDKHVIKTTHETNSTSFEISGTVSRLVMITGNSEKVEVTHYFPLLE